MGVSCCAVSSTRVGAVIVVEGLHGSKEEEETEEEEEEEEEASEHADNQNAARERNWMPLINMLKLNRIRHIFRFDRRGGQSPTERVTLSQRDCDILLPQVGYKNKLAAYWAAGTFCPW